MKPEGQARSIDPADILTAAELAARLKVDLTWVYEKSRSGGAHGSPLPTLHCGRYLRFDWCAVCRWMQNGQG